MAYCIKCGAQLPDDAAFCGNCGGAQGQQNVQQNLQQNTQQNMQAAQGTGAPQYVQQPQMQPQAPQTDGNKRGGNKGLIIGLVAGVAALLVVIAVLGIKLINKPDTKPVTGADTGISSGQEDTGAGVDMLDPYYDEDFTEKAIDSFAEYLTDYESHPASAPVEGFEEDDLPEDVKFRLIFLDDDKIPELVVANGTGPQNPAHLMVYDPVHDRVTEAGAFSMYGEMYYIPEEGFIMPAYYTSPVSGEILSYKHGSVDPKAVETWDWDPDTDAYLVNGEEVSQEEHTKTCGKWATVPVFGEEYTRLNDVKDIRAALDGMTDGTFPASSLKPDATTSAEATEEEITAFLSGGEWSLAIGEGPPRPSFRFYENGTFDYLFDPTYSYDPDKTQPATCSGTFTVSKSRPGLAVPDILSMTFTDIPASVQPRYPSVVGEYRTEATMELFFHVSGGGDYLMLYPAGNTRFHYAGDAIFRDDYSAEGIQSEIGDDYDYDYGFAAPWLYSRYDEDGGSALTELNENVEEDTEALRRNETFYAFAWTSGTRFIGDDLRMHIDLTYMKPEAVDVTGASADLEYVDFLYDGAWVSHSYEIADEAYHYWSGIHGYLDIGAPVRVTTDKNGVIIAMQEMDYVSNRVWTINDNKTDLKSFLEEYGETLSQDPSAFPGGSDAEILYSFYEGTLQNGQTLADVVKYAYITSEVDGSPILLIGTGSDDINQIFVVTAKGVRCVISAGYRTNLTLTEEGDLWYNGAVRNSALFTEIYSTYGLGAGGTDQMIPYAGRYYDEEMDGGPYFSAEWDYMTQRLVYTPVTEAEYDTLLDRYDNPEAKLDWKPLSE